MFDRARWALAALALLLAACLGPPAMEEAAGTPAAPIAAESFAILLGEDGVRGAAVAIADGVVLTNRHVLRGVAPLRLRRALGGAEAEATVLGVSERIDLAVLSVPAGFLRPARLAEKAPAAGAEVWALGPSGPFGRGVAVGEVVAPARLSGFGPGFVARMPALMGFSGGPVVGRDGAVLGLTTALAEPGSARLAALLFGFDLDGVLRGERRRVFVLAGGPIRAEAERLLGRALPQGE